METALQRLRKQMRASPKDNVEGTMHQVNGKVTANGDLKIEVRLKIWQGTSGGKSGGSTKSLNARMLSYINNKDRAA